jgi:transposase
MQARLGTPKAITATAHKLARIFYRLWTSGTAYTDPGINAYEHQYRERVVKNLKKKAQSLGFDLVAQSQTTECVS